MSTKSDSAIYAEKPIATYEAQYRENPVAKPQDIELTITAESIHGKAFKVEQIATMEEEVYYSRFANKIADISTISINTYIKDKPIYISFITENAVNKNAKDRRRVVVPSLPNPEVIVEQIIDIKSKLKNVNPAKTRRNSDAAEAKRRADEEFERKYTEGFEPEQVTNTDGLLKNEDKIKRQIDFTMDDAPVAETKIEEIVTDPITEAPAPEAVIAAEPEAAIPETAAIPEAAAIPEPAAELRTEKKKRPAPIPAPVELEVIEEIEAVAEIIPEVAIIPEAAIIPEPEPVPAAEPVKAPEPESVPAAEPVKAPEPVKAAEPAPTPAPAPDSAKSVTSNISNMSLSDFEAAVKKLKIMQEQGLLTEEEFAAEKRKVLTNLY